jgi:hypothetical protein
MSLEKIVKPLAIGAWILAEIGCTITGYQNVSDSAAKGQQAYEIFSGCYYGGLDIIMASPLIAYVVEKYQKSVKMKLNQKV